MLYFKQDWWEINWLHFYEEKSQILQNWSCSLPPASLETESSKVHITSGLNMEPQTAHTRLHLIFAARWWDTLKDFATPKVLHPLHTPGWASEWFCWSFGMLCSSSVMVSQILFKDTIEKPLLPNICHLARIAFPINKYLLLCKQFKIWHRLCHKNYFMSFIDMRVACSIKKYLHA